MVARRSLLPENPSPYVKSSLERRMYYHQKSQERVRVNRNIGDFVVYTARLRSNLAVEWLLATKNKQTGSRVRVNVE
jgi:hypothetical protein